ncbi:MAG: pyrrolo-quinoline quinone, partial [Planctomycetaceae bacterium]|nr:pyrrolo-quinoline quinone [Planctomycetaceae bacterium]
KYSSLAAQGVKILALDQEGELLLIKANPKEFELIDRRKVSEDETWAHLAITGGQIFVRELKALTALEWKLVEK